MAFQAGNAYITVTPSLRGFQRALKRGIENSQLGNEADRKGAQIGAQVTAGTARTIQSGGSRVAAAVAATFRGTTRVASQAALSVGRTFMRYVGTPIARGAATVGRVVARAFSSAGRWVSGAATAVGRTFMSNVARPISRGAATIGRAVGGAFSSAGRWASSAASTVGRAFMSALPASLQGGLSRIGQSIGSAFSSARQWVSRAASTVGGVFTRTIVPGVGRGLSRVGQTIGSAFSASGRYVSRAASTVGGVFTNTVAPALSRGASRVSSAVGTMFSGARSVAGRVGTQVSQTFSSALSGIGTRLTNLGPQISSLGGQFQSVGSSISGVGSTLTRSLTVPIGGAVAAAGGLVAALGFGRLVGVDTARAKLQGLGYDVGDVERISGGVTKAIEGTMITMAEGTNIAVGALGAGVEEGEELESYIRLVGDAANFANVPIDRMAEVFNRVQGSGKLMLGELNMMENMVPGASAKLAESYGVSQDAFREMVSAGEVDAERFVTVMDDYLGGAGAAYAQSWQGLVKNTGAYIGIIGETILSGAFQQAKDELNSFVEFLSSPAVNDWASDMGAKVGAIFTRIIQVVKSAISWWMNLDGSQQRLILTLGGLAIAAGPVLLVVGKLAGAIGAVMRVAGPVVSHIGAFASRMAATAGSGGVLGNILRTVLGGALRFLTGPIGLIVTALTLLWTNSEAFRNSVVNLAQTLWTSLVSAFQMLWPQVQGLMGALGGLFSAVFGGTSSFGGLGTVVSWVVTGLGWLLNIAIQVVAYLLSGLIGALTWLTNAFSGVATVVINGLGAAMSWLSTVVFPALGTAAMWLWQNAILPAWNGIRWAISGVVTWLQTVGWPIMQTIFSAIGSVISWLWTNIAMPAFAGLRIAWNAVATAISWAWVNILQPAFRGLGAVISWLWTNIAMPYFGFVRTAFRALGTAISWAWVNIIGPAIRGFGSVIRWLWANVAMPVFRFIGNAFSGMGTRLSGIYTAIIRPVFRVLGSIIRWLWTNVGRPFFGYLWQGFQRMGNFLRIIWQSILRPVFRAVGSIIRWLWNNVALPVFGFIRGAWSRMVLGFRLLWQNILRPVFRAVASVVRWLWNNIARPLFSLIRTGWSIMVRGIQALWNNILRPAFRAVGAIIRWLWNNVARPLFGFIRESWRRLSVVFRAYWQTILRPMFRAVANIIRWLWNNIAKPVFKFIRDRWQWLSNGLRAIWRNFIRPMFEALGQFVRMIYRDYISPAFTRIRNRWNWLKDRLLGIWRNNIRPIFQAVGDFVRKNLVNRISSAVDRIRDLWNKLKARFRSPINAVIKWVVNKGLIGAFNKVAGFIPGVKDIKEVDEIKKFRTGGAVRGKGTGTSDDIMARLSDGEHVLTSAEVKALGGQDKVYTLRDKIRSGEPLDGDDVERISAAKNGDYSSSEAKALSGMAATDALPMGGNIFDDLWEGTRNLWNTGRDALGDAIEWAAGGLKSAAEKLLDPIFKPLTNWGKNNGFVGKFGVGIAKLIRDKIFDWAGGADDEYNASMSGGGQGLSGMDAFLWALREVESNQNYRATNPFSDASGAYQFISSTWNGYGGYARAADAPKDVQDARARRDASRFYRQYGNWEQTAAAWMMPALAGNRAAWDRSYGLGNPALGQYVRKVMDALKTARAPKGGGGGVPFTANPGGFNRPSSGPVTSRYGPRNYSGYYGNMHYGIDLAAGRGAPVRAAWSGAVARAGRGPGSMGTSIDINHGSRGWTRYFHLSGLNVRRGQTVKGGRRIGSEGGSGGNFAPHLHFETHRGRPGGHPRSTATNPNNLFRDKGGLLPQGVSQVMNATGGNEYIHNQRQFDNLNAMAESVAGRGSTSTVNVYAPTTDSRGIVNEYARYERRMSRGGARV